MSNRTRDLPPLPGLPGLIRTLRYHEASRQGLGLLLMVIYALIAQPEPISFTLGALLALVGTGVRMWASGYIVKNKELATDGPYSLVRHPLYTGNLLMLVGFTLASGTWWTAIVSAWFWLFYYPPTIDYEDRKLHKIFGDAWLDWSHNVPAVIPQHIVPKGGGAWSFRTSLKQNLEPVIVAFTLGWLVWIALKL